MAEHRCLNCESTIPASARFCPQCSQRTDTARLSFADMTRDLLHAFVNIERGPLVFAWALLTRPGGIAREYVEGRRRRYYGPFATLAVLVGLTALALELSGFQVLSQEVSPVPATVLQRHFNLVLLVQLPLLGVACALLFRDARLTLPEHMVLVAYTLGMRAVALAVATTALASGDDGSDAVYDRLQAKIAGWTSRRDALATQMKSQLAQAAFGREAIDEWTALRLVTEGERLIQEVRWFADRHD